MNRTSISWVRNPDPIAGTGFTWNPVLGCKAVSPGCVHCYAARLASTRLAHLPQYAGLAHDGKWTGEQRFFPEKLAEPLRRRTPSGIFVSDMADLFGEGVTNEQIAAVYGVMAATPQHRYYVLTKRAKRMWEWFEWVAKHNGHPPDLLVQQFAAEEVDLPNGSGPFPARPWPLSNVWIGCSVENQAAADERIPELLATPAAVRFLSMEPLLEAVDLSEWVQCIDHCDECGAENGPQDEDLCPECGKTGTLIGTCGAAEAERYRTGERYDPDSAAGHSDVEGTNSYLSLIIIGGESGSRARPFHVKWACSILRQCKGTSIALFVKQLGANCQTRNDDNFTCGDGDVDFPGWPDHLVAEDRIEEISQGMSYQGAPVRIHFRDRAGADQSEWREDLRVRQMPAVRP